MSLAKKLAKLSIPADGAVDIRVQLHDDHGGASIWLQCMACDVEMYKNSVSNRHECAECGYEITKNESTLIAQRHIEVIRKQFKLDELGRKKGWLWRFTNWYVNRKRLPAPKS